eukprot:TRINITY_DN1703_c0_g1_i6.p1 TRINITY_DN1703_c0_g1~~TRINITY_DN1703_c0_g1_i6.p1  ORF type:complete len:620 (-),score=170.53 TRINITY_DN1703_c0_g1_i6:134-1993(-)
MDLFKEEVPRREREGVMSKSLTSWLSSQLADLSGIIGLGGSSGTALLSSSFQSLPIGFPKVLVSTVASGNVAPFVGCSDITLMYSVTDIAGLNKVSRKVLTNAAQCIAGMARGNANFPEQVCKKSAVGLTMFGVTTPCVDKVLSSIQETTEPIVFHATGAGGQSLEKMIDDGLFDGVIDVTTTEVADFLVGGVMPCTEDRFGAVARTQVPCVVSCGALDMVNFGEFSTIPEKFKDRLFHIHNSQVTLMRTTEEENKKMGEWIATALNKCEGQVRFVIPEKGVSMLDKEGSPFYDPKADAALFESIKGNLIQTENRKLISVPFHINDPEFSQILVDQWTEIAQKKRGVSEEGDKEESEKEIPETKEITREQIAPLQISSTGYSRDVLLSRFRQMVEARIPIIGGGAGVGISAKCEEAGGIDLIVIYNSGRYRMAGRGSLAGLLAYGNANDIVVDMAKEVIPVVKRTPVLAGVNGTDPFMNTTFFLRKLKELGFSGVQNFPTVGLIDGTFRANLEETGMGYDLEVEMIRKANIEGLLTTPYVFSVEDSIKMARAGADIIVCHLGLTVGGGIGAQTAKTLEEAPAIIDEWSRAARSVKPDIIVLCHGGPIATPEDAQVFFFS